MRVKENLPRLLQFMEQLFKERVLTAELGSEKCKTSVKCSLNFLAIQGIRQS